MKQKMLSNIYYEQRVQMDQQIRAALADSSIFLLLMLVVIVALLTRVLSVFDEALSCLAEAVCSRAGHGAG